MALKQSLSFFATKSSLCVAMIISILLYQQITFGGVDKAAVAALRLQQSHQQLAVAVGATKKTTFLASLWREQMGQMGENTTHAPSLRHRGSGCHRSKMRWCCEMRRRWRNGQGERQMTAQREGRARVVCVQPNGWAQLLPLFGLPNSWAIQLQPKQRLNPHLYEPRSFILVSRIVVEQLVEVVAGISSYDSQGSGELITHLW